MKKAILSISLVTSLLFTSSCATVFGGHVTDVQRTKPKAGEPQRQIRVAALICDILLFWPGTIIDFADCAIYKPR